MKITYYNLIHTTFLFIIMIGLSSVSLDAYAEITLGEMELVKSKRVSRVEYEYTFKTTLTNSGDKVLANVRADITSNSENTTIIDGVLEFGTINNNGEKPSIDTFTIKHNRRYPLDTDSLNFEYTFEEVQPPELRSFEFVEYKGREGHKGMLPVIGNPSAGSGHLMVTTKHPIETLTVTVVTESDNTKFQATPYLLEFRGINTWLINLDIPTENFSLLFEMTDPYGNIIEKAEQALILSKSFSVNITQDRVDFSPGDNLLTLNIKNHGETSLFDIEVTGNQPYIENSFDSLNITIEEDETGVVNIPVIIPKGVFLHKLTIHASINGLVHSIDVLVHEEAISLNSTDTKMVINPGNCGDVDPTNETIEIVIVGTSRVDVENIDTSSIELGVALEPISFEIIDKLSSTEEDCNSLSTDGKKDLVLTFDLQSLINNEQQKGGLVIPFYIDYYTLNKHEFSHDGEITLAE